jgi:hypothetical protein
MKTNTLFGGTLILLLLFSGCSDESTPTQLENRPVYLKFINNSQFDINYLQAEFGTNYGEFFVNLGTLASGEISEAIELPSAAHDVNRSHIIAEVNGFEGLEIQFGEQVTFTRHSLPFIAGEYYYVIDLKHYLSKEFRSEPADFPDNYTSEDGNLRFRIQNSGGFALREITVYNVKEECRPTGDLFADKPDYCYTFEGFMYPAISVDYLGAGETSSYFDLPFGYSSSLITAISALGDSLSLYPYDHGPYDYLIEEPGAYTYNLSVETKTQLVRDLTYVDRYIWSPKFWD